MRTVDNARRDRRAVLRGSRRAIVATALIASLIAVAAPVANAQVEDWSIEVGRYSVADDDAAVRAAVLVSPAGTGLAAVSMHLEYDPALVSVTACDVGQEMGIRCRAEEPGRLLIDAVHPGRDGWVEDFLVAEVEFQALGVEAAALLDLTLLRAYNSALSDVTEAGESYDGEIIINSRAPAATLQFACVNGDGALTATLDNPMDDPVTFVVDADSIDSESFVVEPMTTRDEVVGGLADAGVTAASIAAEGWSTLFATQFEVACDPPVATSVTCGDDGGSVTIEIVNYSGSFSTYVAVINERTQQRSISNGLRTTASFGPFVDGEWPLTVARNAEPIFDAVISVDCGVAAPEPAPTPTPEPAEPGPDLGDGDGAGGNEVQVVVTCLAGNGRVDHNIVNTTGAAATYRVEFGALSAREFNVAAEDWRRQPITGRPDGEHQVVVRRDGVAILDQTITVACDNPDNELDEPEVQLINACRNGLGYVIFQFANPTGDQRGWVIEWEGLPNRSTSAAPRGGAVKAVTGRPSGTYDAQIRVGSTYVAALTIEVDCG